MIAAQLPFEDFTLPSAEACPEPEMVDAFLAIYGGDYRAAMRELLLDADFLRDQLATAHRLMSHGYSRGWKPKYERV